MKNPFTAPKQQSTATEQNASVDTIEQKRLSKKEKLQIEAETRKHLEGLQSGQEKFAKDLKQMRESTDRKLQGYQEKLDGLVDGLASDYIPTSLLPSAVRLVSQRIATLPEAVRLVTSGPAACVGLDDRGTLTEGTVADLVLVDFSKTWPSVITMRAATAAEV